VLIVKTAEPRLCFAVFSFKDLCFVVSGNPILGILPILKPPPSTGHRIPNQGV
jgi:hypothetical protein